VLSPRRHRRAYLDLFEKRDGTWKIAKRKVTYDTIKAYRAEHMLPKVGTVGSRSLDDPLFACARRLDWGSLPMSSLGRMPCTRPC
jgi:hypothetical protein